MIVKFCAAGQETFVEADEVYTERVADGISVRITRGEHQVAQYLLPINPTGEPGEGYARAYVMEGGKTVDRIQP